MRAKRVGLVGAVVGVAVLVGAGVAWTALGGDDDRPGYCAALDEPGGRVLLVHLDPDVEPATVTAIGDDLAAVDGLVGPEYVDRDASFAEAEELFDDQPTMQELLRAEDIPTSWRMGITADDVEAAARAVVEDREGVLDVSTATEHVEDGDPIDVQGCD